VAKITGVGFRERGNGALKRWGDHVIHASQSQHSILLNQPITALYFHQSVLGWITTLPLQTNTSPLGGNPAARGALEASEWLVVRVICALIGW